MGRERSWCDGWPVALGVGALLACQAPDRPAFEECGNGIIEPAAGEDCEPVQDTDRCGAVGAGAEACRWVCALQGCPDGFHCGVDAICRRPCLGHEGEPECSPFATLSTDVTTAEIAQLALIDVVGDGRPELMAVELRRDEGDAVARIYRFDGDAIVVGEPAPVGEFSTLTRLQADGAFHLIAPRFELAPVPADADGESTQALVSALEDDLRFREALIQGPVVVDPGALRLASIRVPDDLPGVAAASLLLGFGAGTLWQPEGEALVLPTPGAPEDLLGPVLGQPIAPAVAQAQGHEASQFCDVVVYAYAGAAALHTYNPCEAAVPGWTSQPVTLPTLPAGAAFGDGLQLTDLNGDALADLVITADDNRIYRAHASGDGTFGSPLGDPGEFGAGVGWPGGTDASLGVIAAGDYDGDGEADFITRSTWINSCTVDDCGTCDVQGYRCDAQAPGFHATPASVLDFDGDGAIELAVLARAADDPFLSPAPWGAEPPAAGDLVLVDDPGTADWSRRVFPMSGTARLLTSGDLDGDGRDDVVLAREREAGDDLVVVFGGGDPIVVVEDLGRIVDAHLQRGEQLLAVVSEDPDGAHRRLSRLTATHDRELRSTVKLALQVVPRQIVPGRFDPADPDGVAMAVIGEGPADAVTVELITRGGGNFFDASTRRSATIALGGAAASLGRVRAVAIDLDGDAVDELVVVAQDATLRTLRVQGGATGPAFAVVASDPVLEPFAGPVWPGHSAEDRAVSLPMTRDLDGDGDLDLWLMTAESVPRVVAFVNRGDGTLDVAGRVISSPPTPELSVCDDPDCSVAIRAFVAFDGPSDRSLSVAEHAVDVLLASRRALFLWTFDPLDGSTARQLPLVELAVVRGGRLPLSPPGGPVLAAVGDIDGDGVQDVVAAGSHGIRWLSGLAVNP